MGGGGVVPMLQVLEWCLNWDWRLNLAHNHTSFNGLVAVSKQVGVEFSIRFYVMWCQWRLVICFLGGLGNMTRELCMMATPISSLLYIKNARLLLHLWLQEKLVRINQKWERKEKGRKAPNPFIKEKGYAFEKADALTFWVKRVIQKMQVLLTLFQK